MTGGELAVACLLDAMVGDPRWFPHPVRGMGALVNWCDERVYQLHLSFAKQRMIGMLLALVLPGGAYAAGALLIWSGSSVGPSANQPSRSRSGSKCPLMPGLLWR